MKLKDYVAYLQKLDQERNIFVIYDGNEVLSPMPDKTADEEDAKQFADKGVKEGDFIISAYFSGSSLLRLLQLLFITKKNRIKGIIHFIQ